MLVAVAEDSRSSQAKNPQAQTKYPARDLGFVWACGLPIQKPSRLGHVRFELRANYEPTTNLSWNIHLNARGCLWHCMKHVLQDRKLLATYTSRIRSVYTLEHELKWLQPFSAPNPSEESPKLLQGSCPHGCTLKTGPSKGPQQIGRLVGGPEERDLPYQYMSFWAPLPLSLPHAAQCL